MRRAICVCLVVALTLGLSAPGWATLGVPVLIYHDLVTDDRPPSKTVIHVDRFRQQTGTGCSIRSSGCSVSGQVPRWLERQ